MKTTFKLSSLTLLTLSLLCACGERTPRKAAESNYVVIDSLDSEEQIIWKAAHVVPSPRQLEWQKQELTAFAHFGLNTFADKQWGSGNDDPSLFNPTAFDPAQWVSTLKKAGFRSLILTCKHHDGFCLWPSEYTDYSVKSSPWMDGKGDVVRAVSDACHEQGLGFGVYLSPWDRHEKSYGSDGYNDYFVNQLTELLTLYGPVCEVWFDGANGEGPNGKKQEYDYDRWYRLIRELQPGCVIAVVGPDVRWVGNERGVARESEWSVVPNANLSPEMIAENSQKELIVPPTRVNRDEDLGSRELLLKAGTLVWYPAECDVSIRPSWFYTDSDNGKTKSAERLMDIYFSSVGRNSNLLLNIPPNREGLFGEDEVKSLTEFAHMKDSLFAENLLESARISLDSRSDNGLRELCDSVFESSIALAAGNDGGWGALEFCWDNPQTFSTLLIQEDISQGQRIEEFSLEYQAEDGQWLKAAEGTTVGYKRLLRFDPVKASRLRLVIPAARHTPVLSEVGLY
ncbi:MAG: alpha-L-fucosidase [Bacteroidales bacterium]|nr:alpha-L-fucosidase [Bacteroidales bacterium]